MSQLPALLPARRAFTLVELLVALVLADIGLLALAGAGAALAREVAAAARRTEAITAGQARLELLGAEACRDAQGSGAPAALIRQTWRAQTDSARGVRVLEVTTEYREGTRWRAIVLRSRAPC